MTDAATRIAELEAENNALRFTLSRRGKSVIPEIIAAQDRIAKLEAQLEDAIQGSTLVKQMKQIAALTKERDHWIANHANRVEAARVLIERTDLPIERIRSYESYIALQERVSTLTSKLDVAVKTLEYYAGEYIIGGEAKKALKELETTK